MKSHLSENNQKQGKEKEEAKQTERTGKHRPGQGGGFSKLPRLLGPQRVHSSSAVSHSIVSIYLILRLQYLCIP